MKMIHIYILLTGILMHCMPSYAISFFHNKKEELVHDNSASQLMQIEQLKKIKESQEKEIKKLKEKIQRYEYVDVKPNHQQRRSIEGTFATLPLRFTAMILISVGYMLNIIADEADKTTN